MADKSPEKVLPRRIPLLDNRYPMFGLWMKPSSSATWLSFSELGGVDCASVSMERSGSHIAGYNYWLERTAAKVYLFTHPDLLFPVNTVRVAYELAQPNTYVAFKCFWLSPDMTRDLDKFDWRHPETLEQEPMLFHRITIGLRLYAEGFYRFEMIDNVGSTRYWRLRDRVNGVEPTPDGVTADFRAQSIQPARWFQSQMVLDDVENCIQRSLDTVNGWQRHR